MKEKALFYYHNGYNCAQCVLIAASERFGFPMSREMLEACYGVSGGLGVGSICGALVGGIMAFGMLFPEDRAIVLRMQLLSRFHERYNSLNCCSLSLCRNNCDEIVADVACITEELIAIENGSACCCKRG